MSDDTVIQGDYPRSVDSLSSPASQADSASLLYQQALVLHRQNRLDDAKSLYRQVLAIDPNHAGAWHFLGAVALIQNDLAKAREHIEQALVLCDTNPIYHNNHGVVLKTIGCLHEAKTAFEKAVTLHQEYADAWSNFGQILLLLKEEEQSIEHALTRALQIVPNHPDAISHLAELRHRQERHAECAELLVKILPRQPNDAGLLCRIAESHIAAKQYNQAINFLLRVSQLTPNHEEIQHWLGICYGETGEIAKAKPYFRKAATLPKGKTPWRWKHLWYCPVYFDNASLIDEYWQQLYHDLDEAIAENNIYEWQTLVYDGFTSSFHLPHHDKCCREVKEKFTQLFAPSFAQFKRPEPKSPHRRKIRVGFLVTPGHEGGFYRYTSDIIKRLDPNRFEAYLIYHDMSAKTFQSMTDFKHVTHLTFDWNFEASVAKIKNAECDIIYLWKVGADVWNFFLPMCRLAPIQFTSWGTHGTSGVRHIDYSLSYRLAEIDNAQEHYTESLYLMDEAPAFQPRMQLPHTFSREELGLPTRGAIYYCPHRLSKYHPDYDFYLKGILENDPEGRILLLLGETSPQAEKIKERMRRNIGNTLIKRMIFIPSQPPRRYNQLMAAATTILDSHIYSGGITAYDSMSYGVPSVTKVGPLLVQRYPYSSYRAMGIEDAPTATNRDEYVRAAVRVGTDSEYRRHLSSQILERGDLIFERPNVVSQFESFFENILEIF